LISSFLFINIFFLFTVFLASLYVRSTSKSPNRPVRGGYQYLYLSNHVIFSTAENEIAKPNEPIKSRMGWEIESFPEIKGHYSGSCRYIILTGRSDRCHKKCAYVYCS
jgi:hypothetical protein